MLSAEPFAVHVAIADLEKAEDPGQRAEDDSNVIAVTEALTDADISLDGVAYSRHGHGYGADGIAAGIVLTGLSALFFSGKKIEENIQAWLRLGRKLRGAIDRLHESGVTPSFSEPAIVALALETVARDGAASALSVLSVTTVPVHNASLTPLAHGDFLEHPHRYYVVVIRSGTDRAAVVIMSADGRLYSHTAIPLNKWAYEYSGRSEDRNECRIL